MKLKAKLLSGELKNITDAEYQELYKRVYKEEYYRIYDSLKLGFTGETKIVYVNRDQQRYWSPHAPVKFSKTNLLIRINNSNKSVSIGRFYFPIDKDICPETKEANLISWPGPLDKHDDRLKEKVTDYMDTLGLHDSHRRIRYNNNDEQRKTIIDLLTVLLRCDGTIDALSITKLLLKPEQTEITKDETLRRPLETLQKKLLLGKRIEAIRFATEKKLYDHALLLNVLESGEAIKTNPNPLSKCILGDTFVQTIDEFINAIEDHRTLKLFYKSLLNIIKQSDPKMAKVYVKHPDVGNNAYEFAMLTANNCPIEFDQTNEIFKLITCAKQATINELRALSYSHLISLGFSTLDYPDTNDDLSYRSHTSFRQDDNFASRTLKISNIDMLIMNEVFEYCLNLANGRCNTNDYEYIINLVPYKLIFATKLFDFGLYEMFANYLYSMQRALLKSKQNPEIYKDPFYDWVTIESCVDFLSEIWTLFQRGNPDAIFNQESLTQNIGYGLATTAPLITNNASPYQTDNPYQPPTNDYQYDYMDTPQNDYPSIPYQGESVYQQFNQNIPSQFNQLAIKEEVNENEPEESPQDLDSNSNVQYDNYRTQPQQQNSYNDQSNEPSRRPSASQSIDGPLFSPPGFGPPSMHYQSHKTMTSSSPVNKTNTSKDGYGGGQQSKMADSFSTPYSPIDYNGSLPANNSIGDTTNESHQASAQTTRPSQSDKQPLQQSSGDQQAGFLKNIIAGARNILPKSNSKPMILPDDSEQPIKFDQDTGRWVDSTNPNASDGIDPNDAPPTMNIASPPNYSFDFQRARPKNRYARS